MFVKKPWKWTMDCWEVTAKKKVVKEDSPDLGRKLVKRQLQRLGKRGLGRALRRSSICRKGWKLWRRRLVSPQNGKGHHLKTLPLHLNRRSNPGLVTNPLPTRD
ncbi:BnaC01g19990D [Brassica napus]|uniref:BnaC01g19990D protein n=1 Tax=Brassica napus TaxID=3708 RepID=A0A078HUS1_BRANA|nr:BnaC01g19990D [Brassica napus]